MRATFYEYTLPNARSMPHSLTVDGAGRVWISGWDSATNAVLKFDPSIEQFRTYPVPTANAVPHTPCITRDGRVWMALNASGVAKVAVIDPKTDQLVEVNWPAKMPGTHNCQEDRAGNIWFSSLGERDEGFARYDPRTQQFRSYKHCAARRVSGGLWRCSITRTVIPRQRWRRVTDAKVDSAGRGWGVAYSMGMIVSVDPKTGETNNYFAPVRRTFAGCTSTPATTYGLARSTITSLASSTRALDGLRSINHQPKGRLRTDLSKIQGPDISGLAISTATTSRDLIRGPRHSSTYPFPSRNVNPRLGIGIDPQGRIWFTEFMNGRIGVLIPGTRLGRRRVRSRSLLPYQQVRSVVLANELHSSSCGARCQIRLCVHGRVNVPGSSHTT